MASEGDKGKPLFRNRRGASLVLASLGTFFAFRSDLVPLLLGASVAAHELVHAAGGVHQLALARIEGVRGATDFQLYYGVSLALEFHGFGGFTSRAAQEHVAVAHVLEDNGTVVLGMNTFLHIFLFYFVFMR